MQAQRDIAIRDFQPGDEDAFRRLNEEWILKYFAMEPKDEEALGNPARIIDAGGRILFAVRDGEPVGCCALLAKCAGEFEVAKMAVTAKCQGAGVGRRLLQAVITAAREMGARRLLLETNSALASAIHLYEAAGFQHLPAGRAHPSPYARCDVAMELSL